MISVVIPARNEEKFIGRCLDSLKKSAELAHLSDRLEIVVVLNRCTDGTEAIAQAAGAKCVREDASNLSIIRNVGVRASRYPIVVTVDADSRVSLGMLSEIKTRLERGDTVGGGVRIVPERYSLGILLTGIFLFFYVVFFYRVSGGLFWFLRSDFEKIRGFNESLLTIEDLDFAWRLKRLGQHEHRPFQTLWRNHIVTSCRKFDRFGDWFLFLHPIKSLRLLAGRNNKREADEFFYQFKR